MYVMRTVLFLHCLFSGLLVLCAAGAADLETGAFIQNHCVDCHNSDETNGMVNFDQEIGEGGAFANASLIERVIKELTSGAMPPPEASSLTEADRDAAIKEMRMQLQRLVESLPVKAAPASRLNRFQYNYTVRDLFRLDRDIFLLSEKLMDRDSAYLQVIGQEHADRRIADQVRVLTSSAVGRVGMRGVKAFPKDLRAEHGFDNQADQLTLSPLLLDSFFNLSVSILESPDFNSTSVGVWEEFFADPGLGEDLEMNVRERLRPFLTIAFRQKVESEILERYTNYALESISSCGSFTDGMKKVAAATLSSPLFLYRTSAESTENSCYALASKLSYFLWGSCPDAAILELASTGELRDQKVLNETVDRMLCDPRVVRFLDSFPVQWLQLENVLAATPNPKLSPLYSLIPDQPAGLHMLLEPLILFDMVFVENRPISELLSPEFAYQSSFLQNWYLSDLKPDAVDEVLIQKTNAERERERLKWKQIIAQTQIEINAMIDLVKKGLGKDRDDWVDSSNLKPYAAWEFDHDLMDRVGALDLQAHGDVTFNNGSVQLSHSFLQSEPLADDFVEKSFEVRFSLDELDQPGGGLMTMQGPRGLFDSIVIGERQNRHWISGSNGFRRTEDFLGSFAEMVTTEPIHLVMTYEGNGETKLYRNGVPYGKPFNKGREPFPKKESTILFGLRHLPAGGNRYLSVSIDQAKLYDRVLTPKEVHDAYQFGSTYISNDEMKKVLSEKEIAQFQSLRKQLVEASNRLVDIPEDISVAQVQKDNQRSFEERIAALIRQRDFQRVKISDPRYGGIMTNAAVLTMTSGPDRTHPVARGVWIAEVIYNDPPSPPPNDIPPLSESEDQSNLTIREQFSIHRENPSCAGCHNQLDPLGFALENYDVTGRWRTHYANGRPIDSSGNLFERNIFETVGEFKKNLVSNEEQFAQAFAEHLMRYALGRDLSPKDRVEARELVLQLEAERYPLRDIIKSIIQSKSFTN
jgi:hypothetical protein